MKLVLFIRYYFSKKKSDMYLPLQQKFEKTICSRKQILRNFSLNTLKYHQHRIKGKNGILLKIILNVFDYLLVSLVPIKFLL